MVDTSVHWARPPWQGVAVAVAIRDNCRLLTLRKINDAFAAELGGLSTKHKARESELQPQMGERRARATVWLERIAWSEEPPLKLGEVLSRLRERLAEESDDAWEPIARELSRVGWRVNGYGPLVSLAGLGALPKLDDAQGITDEWSRLENALISGDLHGAVGYTKNLVEGTAKFAHARLIGDPGRRVNFQPLVKSVGERLVDDLPSDAPSALGDFLEDLNAAVLRFGTLRNRVDGTAGHGAPVWDPWLMDAHSRVVAEVGIAWVRFVLEQLEAGQRPEP